MSPINQISLSQTFAFMDVGAKNLILSLVKKKGPKQYEILGGAEVPLKGLHRGQVKQMSDVVESVRGAIQKLKTQTGVKISRLYYSYDDISMRSYIGQASKFLASDAGIKREDLDILKETATRSVSNFFHHVLYCKDIEYIADQKDRMLFPLGVFAQSLEAKFHFVDVPAQNLELWKKIMMRAGVADAIAVLSSWATAVGVIPAEDRVRRRVVLDLGNDYINFFVYEHETIQAIRIIQTEDFMAENLNEAIRLQTMELIQRFPNPDQIILTGDMANDAGILTFFREYFPVPIVQAAPQNIAKFAEARLATLVGLASIADELESQVSILERQSGLLVEASNRIKNLINEYL